jgi:hypothetical protein
VLSPQVFGQLSQRLEQLVDHLKDENLDADRVDSLAAASIALTADGVAGTTAAART